MIGIKALYAPGPFWKIIIQIKLILLKKANKIFSLKNIFLKLLRFNRQ